MPGEGGSLLRGKCVLVVEDEILVAMDLVAELEGADAEVVAITGTVKQALEAVRGFEIDLAVLDGNLGGERVDTIAEELNARAIPFCFFSGYSREHLPPRFSHIPVVQKPFDAGELLATLGDLLKAPDRGHDRTHSERGQDCRNGAEAGQA
jgi:CheY-like chemotaxis protein